MSMSLLPEYILYYISKHYLSEEDCLNLSLSGVNKQYTTYYNK